MAGQNTQAKNTQTRNTQIPKIPKHRGQDKRADFENETKPPISKMRQNRRFRK